MSGIQHIHAGYPDWTSLWGYKLKAQDSSVSKLCRSATLPLCHSGHGMLVKPNFSLARVPIYGYEVTPHLRTRGGNRVQARHPAIPPSGTARLTCRDVLAASVWGVTVKLELALSERRRVCPDGCTSNDMPASTLAVELGSGWWASWLKFLIGCEEYPHTTLF